MKSIKSKEFKPEGKKVLIRVEYNVPMDAKGKITNNNRILKSIPTIKHILKKKPAQLILMCHIGRPKEGADNSKLKTDVVAKELEKILGKKVSKVDHCGEGEMPSKKIVMLENLRFYSDEKKGGVKFSKKLASLADIYVNESFGTSHRKDASMYTVPKQFKKCFAGLQLEEEVLKLGEAVKVSKDEKPFVVVLGFAKISDKIKIMETLLKKADKALIGGAVAFSFLKALNVEVGNSMIDSDSVKIAKKLLSKYSKKIVLPSDFSGVNAKNFSLIKGKETRVYSDVNMPKTFIGLDIGPESVKKFKAEISLAKTVFWNGPTGMFEIKPFDKSTNSLSKFIAKTQVKTIVGGGDTASAIIKSKQGPSMYHISTGGGAALEFIEKGTLPALKWIK